MSFIMGYSKEYRNVEGQSTHHGNSVKHKYRRQNIAKATAARAHGSTPAEGDAEGDAPESTPVVTLASPATISDESIDSHNINPAYNYCRC